MSINIQPSEVQSLARAARLYLAPEGVTEMQAKLTEVLEYVSLLQQVYVATGVVEVAPSSLVVRRDVVVPTDRALMLYGAPAHEEGYFTVPAVLQTNG